MVSSSSPLAHGPTSSAMQPVHRSPHHRAGPCRSRSTSASCRRQRGRPGEAHARRDSLPGPPRRAVQPGRVPRWRRCLPRRSSPWSTEATRQAGSVTSLTSMRSPAATPRMLRASRPRRNGSSSWIRASATYGSRRRPGQPAAGRLAALRCSCRARRRGAGQLRRGDRGHRCIRRPDPRRQPHRGPMGPRTATLAPARLRKVSPAAARAEAPAAIQR